MSNRKLGNDFESEFCKILFDNGFWVHNLAQNKAGQPSDVIAVKDGKAYLIDCKVCSGKTFNMSRIEENQNLAMYLWCERGNGYGYFAIKFEENIYMISLFSLNHAKKKTFTEEWFSENGFTLNGWLNKRCL